MINQQRPAVKFLLSKVRRFAQLSAQTFPTGIQKRSGYPSYRCGGEHHSDKCRFKEAECRYCHKKGHIAAACRQKLKSAKPRQIHATSDGLEEQPSEFDLPIDCLKNALSEPMTVVVNINETPVKMEVDTVSEGRMTP